MTASPAANTLITDLLTLPPAARRPFYEQLNAKDWRALVTASRKQLGSPYGCFQDDPCNFIEIVVGDTLWSKQREICESVRDNLRVAVAATHSPGKSWISARLVCWWVSVWPLGTALAVTTAPRMRQVKSIIWPAIRQAHAAGNLPGDVQSVQWKIGSEVYASGFSAGDYSEDAVQGLHSSHLLFVCDEAGGISHTLGRAYAAILSNPHARLLMIGNPPTDEEGSWFETEFEKDRYVHAIRISAYDTPNFTQERTGRCTSCPPEAGAHRVATHLTLPSWVDETIDEFGEDSAFVVARVHADFPRSLGQKVIPLTWIELACEPDHVPAAGTWVRLGADIASDGGDEFVIARAVGSSVTIEHRSSGVENADPTRVAGTILRHLRDACEMRDRVGEERPVQCKIDASGMGWGVAGLVKRQAEENHLPAKVYGVRGEDKPHDEVQFKNCLTEDARVRPVGDLRQVFRGWSDGPFYRVKMASGDEFTATGHHNVLTRSGWVEVHRLDVGDELVYAGGDGSGPADPQVGQMPATIGEVYRAAVVAGQVERIDAARMNFHGDRLVGDVDVVSVNGDLQTGDPFRREHGDHEPFIGGLSSQRPFTSPSGIGHALGRGHRDTDYVTPQLSLTLRATVRVDDVAAVASGLVPAFYASVVEDLGDVVGGESEWLPRSGGAVASRVKAEGTLSGVLVDELAATQDDTLQPGAWLDALFNEPGTEGPFVAPRLLRERVQRLAGQIPTDKVVSVEVLRGGRHVYTLGTSTGAYTTSTTIHRNCRSEMWWNTRRLLKPGVNAETGQVTGGGQIKFVNAPHRLLSQMSNVKLDDRGNSQGKIVVEPKKRSRARGVHSPDLADAVNLCLYSPPGEGPASVERAPAGRIPLRPSEMAQGGGPDATIIPLSPSPRR